MRSPAIALLPALFVAQSIAVPSFVVPSFADLAIKTRQTFGGGSSTIMTEVLYVKGPRERREHTFVGGRLPDGVQPRFKLLAGQLPHHGVIALSPRTCLRSG